MKTLILGLVLFSSLSHSAPYPTDKQEIFNRLEYASRTGGYPTGDLRRDMGNIIHIHAKNTRCNITFAKFSNGDRQLRLIATDNLGCDEVDYYKARGKNALVCNYGPRYNNAKVILHYSPDKVIYAAEMIDLKRVHTFCQF